MSLPRFMRQRDIDEIRELMPITEICAWELTRRRQRRQRVAWNRAVRLWRLGLGRERRLALRIDPPCDYDELPF